MRATAAAVLAAAWSVSGQEWCAARSAGPSRTPPPPEAGSQFRGEFRDLALWIEPDAETAARAGCQPFLPHRRGNDGLWVVEFDHSLDLYREERAARRAKVPVVLRRNLTLVLGGGAEVPDRLGYDACGMETDKRVISVPAASVKGPKAMPASTKAKYMAAARERRADVAELLENVKADSLSGFIEHFQSYETRNSYSGNNGLNEAADWVAERLGNYGFTVTRHRFRDDMTPQVVAELKGTVEPEKIVVVGAHYDSRGTQSTSPTQRAPGADDNGSGSAAMLEFARIISESGARFKHTLQLMLFTGEEQGLIGSRAIAREYASAGVNVIAMFNADMIGYKRPDEPITQAFMDRYVDMEMTEIAIETTKTYVPQLPVGWTSGCCSDQQSFYENGFPSVGFFENPGSRVYYPQYHRSDDLLQYLNMEQVELQTTALIASATLFAEMQ
eukprot:TRINITY_DN139_c0_g2_i5.p2 TRINITY_DN139_c0_g2~~TRINITY_DN139_c0_g2_i5.p2  ORF type:complete len:445 (+),score=189.26 TRINITY_DN139_c0_g2_i5:57-1391(+)